MILKKRDPDLLVKLVNHISLENLDELGEQARNRIIENFSVDNRKQLLINTLNKI